MDESKFLALLAVTVVGGVVTRLILGKFTASKAQTLYLVNEDSGEVSQLRAVSAKDIKDIKT